MARPARALEGKAMHSAAETFQNCGWTAYLVTLLTLVGILVGVIALVVAGARLKYARFAAAFALIAAVLPVAVGALGTMYGRSLVDRVLMSGAIDPDKTELIRQTGYAEAAMCTTVGGVGTGIVLLPALLALGAALILKPR